MRNLTILLTPSNLADTWRICNSSTGFIHLGPSYFVRIQDSEGDSECTRKSHCCQSSHPAADISGPTPALLAQEQAVKFAMHRPNPEFGLNPGQKTSCSLARRLKELALRLHMAVVDQRAGHEDVERLENRPTNAPLASQNDVSTKKRPLLWCALCRCGGRCGLRTDFTELGC